MPRKPRGDDVVVVVVAIYAWMSVEGRRKKGKRRGERVEVKGRKGSTAVIESSRGRPEKLAERGRFSYFRFLESSLLQACFIGRDPAV